MLCVRGGESLYRMAVWAVSRRYENTKSQNALACIEKTTRKKKKTKTLGPWKQHTKRLARLPFVFDIRQEGGREREREEGT